jgi:2-phospho-L-lactate guanylyltransferase
MSKLSTPGVPFALWLIVPVKAFGEGKSRLASILSPAARAEMSQRWLTHVLTTAMTWGRFAGIAVISRDPAVLALANEWDALAVVESGDGLNAALTQASTAVMAAGAEAILVLPSDLPLLTTTDLDALYHLVLAGDSVVLAPSHDGGTNALLLRPPDAIPYSFGEKSATCHAALAEAAGLLYHLYQSSTLALDIDNPEDLLLMDG